jgi:hypothetical protein
MTDRSRAVLGDGSRMTTKTIRRAWPAFPRARMGIYRVHLGR